jgi:23S rRNA pseudouridine955/2504/2580 synthase
MSLLNMKEIKINYSNANQRIDKFVRRFLNDAPLSFIYKTFRKKDVKVNGHWVEQSYIIQDGDIVRIYVTDEQIDEFNKPKNIESIKVDLKIVYEDQNILIVDKPKGLLVHGDEEEKRLTLTNKVQAYLYQKGEFKNDGVGYIPGPAHRLDRNTSGLVIFAKNLETSQELMDLFKTKEEIEKYYLALVFGETDKVGTINLPLAKNPEKGMVFVTPTNEGGKEAITKYSVIDQNDSFSLVKVQLITGRTHQIRAHFRAINHPLVGDGKYGDFRTNKLFKEDFKYDSQFLIAYEIRFNNVGGKLSYLSNKSFKASISDKEKDILRKLKISCKA